MSTIRNTNSGNASGATTPPVPSSRPPSRSSTVAAPTGASASGSSGVGPGQSRAALPRKQRRAVGTHNLRPPRVKINRDGTIVLSPQQLIDLQNTQHLQWQQQAQDRRKKADLTRTLKNYQRTVLKEARDTAKASGKFPNLKNKKSGTTPKRLDEPDSPTRTDVSDSRLSFFSTNDSKIMFQQKLEVTTTIGDNASPVGMLSSIGFHPSPEAGGSRSQSLPNLSSSRSAASLRVFNDDSSNVSPYFVEPSASVDSRSLVAKMKQMTYSSSADNILRDAEGYNRCSWATTPNDRFMSSSSATIGRERSLDVPSLDKEKALALRHARLVKINYLVNGMESRLRAAEEASQEKEALRQQRRFQVKHHYDSVILERQEKDTRLAQRNQRKAMGIFNQQIKANVTQTQIY